MTAPAPTTDRVGLTLHDLLGVVHDHLIATGAVQMAKVIDYLICRVAELEKDAADPKGTR